MSCDLLLMINAENPFSRRKTWRIRCNRETRLGDRFPREVINSAAKSHFYTGDARIPSRIWDRVQSAPLSPVSSTHVWSSRPRNIASCFHFPHQAKSEIGCNTFVPIPIPYIANGFNMIFNRGKYFQSILFWTNGQF